MKKIFNTLVLFCVALLTFLVFLFQTTFFTFNLNNESEVILVKNGDNARKLAEWLDVGGIYNKPFVSYILMRIMLPNGSLYIGEYEVLKGEGIFSLINKIKNKSFYYRKITFVEGETIERYKDQINSAFGLMGNITEDLDEGYFMSGTYNYVYGEQKNNLIKRAKNDMMNFVVTEFEKVKSDDFYLKNINEVLSLASVVEKESAIGIERTLIAGVFYNRLKKGMKLQSDPTTVYEITKGKYKLNRPLTYDDLKISGIYNTYYIKGIPAFPIATPSREAILAVLHPKQTDSLFFVADGFGGHTFSKNYEDHKKNVQKYREVLKKNK